MGSREKDQTISHHQPLLSSLVVRPSASDGADGVGGGTGGGGRGGSDYEPGEVRRNPPQYSRPDRYSDDPGYRIRVDSTSPLRRRDTDRRYKSDFDRLGGPPRGRDFGTRRDSGRFRDPSPPYSRGRGGGRMFDRGFDRPRFVPRPVRGEGVGRNNPNVRPREGDWICSDPLCANLNFARREFCNNCKKPRYGHRVSPPRRGYPGPLPHPPPRRVPPPLDISPGRPMNGYRSPPRGWARDGPRELGGAGGPPPRHGGRFPDHEIRRERPDYLDDDYRGRGRYDRPPPMDWSHRDLGRDSYFNERKGFDRQIPSSPPALQALPPPRGQWERDELRERSRSPVRGAPLSKDYGRDMYAGQGQDDRRGGGRDRMSNVY